MKAWIDTCTGKQIRYACAIAHRLRSLGHQPILTTRKHPDTLALAHMLGEEFTVVGRYDPTSLLTKLRESVERTLLFCKIFGEDPPDLAISHKSIELCRVAYGLNVPIILTEDTPHAEVVSKLTLPLANSLIVSEAIPLRYYRGYGIKRILQFGGVDEVAWVRDYKPRLSIEEYRRPLIVVRQTETKAYYARGKRDVTEEVARKLASLGQVMFLSRYDRRQKEGMIVPREYVDSVSLVAAADLVVSVGGTIAREAALQGTPSIVIPTLLKPKIYYTNNYLSRLGFPLFIIDPPKVMEYSKKYIGTKWDVKEILGKLENPVDVIEEVVEGEYD